MAIILSETEGKANPQERINESKNKDCVKDF